MHAKARELHPVTERVYVKVNSDFDATGHVNPKSITWIDGQVYPIEEVHDFRPASTAGLQLRGDCYTVLIRGQLKHLFFERMDERFRDRLGRWFVEVTTVV